MNVKIAATTEQNLLISHFQLSVQMESNYETSLSAARRCLIQKGCCTILHSQMRTGDRQHIKPVNTHLFSSLRGGQIYAEIKKKQDDLFLSGVSTWGQGSFFLSQSFFASEP